MVRNLFFLFIGFVLVSCSENNSMSYEEVLWTDSTMTNLYFSSQKRDIKELESYLSGDNYYLLKNALSVVSSVPSSEFVDKLSDLLSTEDSEIRLYAAFAAGQNGSIELLEPLIERLETESEVNVRKEILTAIGKIEDERSISFLSGFNPKSPIESEGHIKGLFHCLLNNNITNSVVRKMVEIARDKNASLISRRYAAGYLGRLPAGFDLNEYAGSLRESYMESSDPEVKQHILIAFGHCNRDVGSLNLLKGVASDENEEFRYRVLALQSLMYFPYIEGIEAVYKAAVSNDTKVSKEAANYILNLGNQNDAVKYLSLGANQKFLPVSARLLEAACKYGDQAILNKVNPFVNETFQKSTDPYSKAALIPLFKYQPEGMDILSELAEKGEHPVIRTSALNELRTSLINDFKDNPAAVDKYEGLFYPLLFSDDTVIVRQVSGLFMSNDLNLLKFIDSEKRKEIEATESLSSLQRFIESGKKPEDQTLYGSSKFDVGELSSMPDTIKASIVTDVGIIEVDLYPKIAPITVLNFITLAEGGYLAGNYVHRVENNFVIQDGCARGDGYGHPPYKIISEFSSVDFDKGVLAMASSGTDTESSQWFITHRFSPHLDGAYTIFGRVTSGMDIVDQIQVGSQIINIETGNANIQ